MFEFNNNEGVSSIAGIMRNICRLQQEAVRAELSDLTCDARHLGCGRKELFNTRPVHVYTDDDQPFHCSINRNDASCNEENRSCTFRIERVQGNTVTLRALVPVGEQEPTQNPCKPGKYLATDSFITINVGCICAIKCLNDSFVDLCIRNFV